jgi:SLOG in TRPM, prokaryote
VNETAGERAVPPHVRVRRPSELPAALRALNVGVGRSVLVFVGGAGGMTPDDLAITAKALERVIPALEEWQAAVVDGGTDSGIMRVMGRLREAAGGHFPLVGVAAEGTVILPGTSAQADAAALEPHHTHVILVPGRAWGDESPWLSRVATVIADGQPSLTLVINGGQITYDDVDHSLRANRPVMVLDGTGRTADAIAAAARGDTADPRAARVAADPGTQIVSCRDPQALSAAIGSVLYRRG